MSSVCFFPTRNSPGERRFLNAEYITGLVLLTVTLEIKLDHANLHGAVSQPGQNSFS